MAIKQKKIVLSDATPTLISIMWKSYAVRYLIAMNEELPVQTKKWPVLFMVSSR